MAMTQKKKTRSTTKTRLTDQVCRSQQHVFPAEYPGQTALLGHMFSVLSVNVLNADIEHQMM